MTHIIDEKFWLAIAFFAFFAALIKYVWPIISNNLKKQSELISKELNDAKEMKETAQRILLETQMQYNKAIKDAEKILENAKIEADKILLTSKNSLEEEVSKKITALNNRIKSEEERVVRDMKAKIISFAIQTISSSSQNIDKSRASNVLKRSIEDISKVIH